MYFQFMYIENDLNSLKIKHCNCLKCYNLNVTIYIMLKCLKCYNLHKISTELCKKQNIL